MSGGYDSPNPLAGPSGDAPRPRIRLKLGNPAMVPHFYTMKKQIPEPAPLTGGMDLLAVYDLAPSFQKLCSEKGAKKVMKEDLNSFLPHLYGNFNVDPEHRGGDISWLKMLIEKPPITGKEIAPLTKSAIDSFKLAPGLVDQQVRWMFEKPRGETGGLEYEFDRDKVHKRFKRSLEPFAEEDGRDSPTAGSADGDRKRHRDDKGDKEKKAKKKKKEKKTKKERDEKL